MADATRTHVWGNTATYEAYMGRWSRPVAETALGWLGLPPGLSWLDVGCGTGALTGSSSKRPTRARSSASIRPPISSPPPVEQIVDPRVRFAIGDARTLPVPDDAYDVVIAGLVLHFVPDPPPAIREMVRAALRAPWSPTSGILPASDSLTRPLWQAATALDPAAAALRPGRAVSESVTQSRWQPCLPGPACRP